MEGSEVRRIIVNATSPDGGQLDEAVEGIRSGAVLAIPTDTFYGLAVDPFRSDAVTRIFDVKGRSAERALLLIAADAAQVSERIGTLPALAARLTQRFWPGPLTLLMTAPSTLGAGVTAGTGKVGVRVPDHLVARALCRACGTPLTATSANISGVPPASDPDEVARSLGATVDILVDAGPTPGGPPSTIVDATGSLPVLVRAGAIAWSEIERYLGLVP
jgi:L-threonylcarbamoyladenylate synthase